MYINPYKNIGLPVVVCSKDNKYTWAGFHEHLNPQSKAHVTCYKDNILYAMYILILIPESNTTVNKCSNNTIFHPHAVMDRACSLSSNIFLHTMFFSSSSSSSSSVSSQNTWSPITITPKSYLWFHKISLVNQGQNISVTANQALHKHN